MRTKGTAAVLAILLGGLGAHKFYLGQYGQGLLYLFFCWTLIPAMIAFIEFFVYIFMSEQEFNRRYNAAALAAHHGNQMGQNVTINFGQDHPMAQRSPQRSITAEIKELKELHVAGALTDAEFAAQKQRVLNSTNAPAQQRSLPHDQNHF